jgi:hypothetical protein
MSPLKNSRSAVRAGLLGLGDSLNEEIAVKDDGSKFGHRLFVLVFFLADGGLGLLYEVVEFFF